MPNSAFAISHATLNITFTSVKSLPVNCCNAFIVNASYNCFALLPSETICPFTISLPIPIGKPNLEAR